MVDLVEEGEVQDLLVARRGSSLLEADKPLGQALADQEVQVAVQVDQVAVWEAQEAQEAKVVQARTDH